MADFTLASEFPQASEEEWLRRVAESVRGGPFDSLISETLDSIRVKPLYASAGIPATLLRPARLEGERPWSIVQRIDMPDLERANRQILEDLENGADGLALVLPGAVTAGGHGVPISALDDLERLTEGVELDLVSVRLDAGRHGIEAARHLLGLYEARGLDAGRCNVAFGLDPLGAFALTGSMNGDAAERLAAVIKEIAGHGYRGAAIVADTRVYHGAGCSEAQELALAVATAIQYLRWLETQGIDLTDAVSRVGFLLTADTLQFLSIAKLRAARLLWARVEAVMGLEPSPLVLHVETAMRMMSRRDPHLNLLRTTAAAFAAGIGGADSLTVVPFTAALGLPDGFARRLARNIQTILQEESGIGTVAEGGAGSGYVEAMTARLAGKAWEIFQGIEAQGGLAAALGSGFVHTMIGELAAKRRRAVAERRQPLTGVSEFPVLEEAPVRVLDMPLPEGWPAGAGRDENGLACPPLTQSRLAEPFERLRDAADACEDRSGRRPAVFLANLGRLADFNARANWTRNLLAAGGIAAVGEGGYPTGEAAGEALRSSGAEIACICSSDAIYRDLAVDAARALKSAGAKRVYVAGRLGEREPELRAAGVDEFLFSGMDVLDALERLHDALGVARAGA